jgi:prefoldin alpha subunit|tara:strand:+ start:2153 stop:2596 length:444 start_codon:yes stop_codon:yes gene_type:complete
MLGDDFYLANNDERAQELLVGLRTLESYLDDVNQRESLLGRAVMETRAAIESINALPTQRNAQGLFPLGAGVFLPSAAPPVGKLIISIGADVAVEKTKKEGEAYLNERLKELETSFTALETQKAEITNRMNATRSALQTLMNKPQQK